MTLEEVNEWVAGVAAVGRDDGVAHRSEDHLHRSVLAAIRDGEGDNPAILAAAALKTRDIDFARWCA